MAPQTSLPLSAAVAAIPRGVRRNLPAKRGEVLPSAAVAAIPRGVRRPYVLRERKGNEQKVHEIPLNGNPTRSVLILLILS